MALPVAQQPVRILGVNGVSVIFALRCRIDASHKVFGSRIQRTLNIKTKAMGWVVEP